MVIRVGQWVRHRHIAPKGKIVEGEGEGEPGRTWVQFEGTSFAVPCRLEALSPA